MDTSKELIFEFIRKLQGVKNEFMSSKELKTSLYANQNGDEQPNSRVCY